MIPRSLATTIRSFGKEARDRIPFLLAHSHVCVPNTMSVIGFTCSKSQDFRLKKKGRFIIGSHRRVCFVKCTIIYNILYYCYYNIVHALQETIRIECKWYWKDYYIGTYTFTSVGIVWNYNILQGGGGGHLSSQLPIIYSYRKYTPITCILWLWQLSH